MAIFSPATSGTSGSNCNPRNTSMYSGGYNFRLLQSEAERGLGITLRGQS
jgi:hypothetical protein